MLLVRHRKLILLYVLVVGVGLAWGVEGPWMAIDHFCGFLMSKLGTNQIL
jgi:hypothetical protein